uniref:Uncharacterized protein n=1 Tax=viral metagenome TaxID=1070528 RepID=A0A6C0JXZ5_9ZZZZ
MFSLINTPNKLSENQLTFLSKYPTLSEYYTTKGQMGAAPFDKVDKLKELLNDVKPAIEDIEGMSMVNELSQREALINMPEEIDDSDNNTDTESRSSSTDSGNAEVEALLPQLNDLQKKVEEQIAFKYAANPAENPVKKSWHGFWGGIKHKTAKRSKKGGRKTHKKRNNKKTTQKKGGKKMQKKSTNKKQ